jgi:threonine dehydrogenase-like Zn-dependent dehydrogenase
MQLMHAAIITAPGQVAVQSVPVPEPEGDQVLVQILGCGVCASNLPLWEGRPCFEYPLERGLGGHEAWGRIVAVGHRLARFEPGDHVAMLSNHAYAEYDLGDAHSIVRIPPTLTGQFFPGEPLGCAFNIFRRSDLRSGQSVAIVGIGFLGALLTRLASLEGARVIAISRRPFARQIALQMGAAETIEWQDSHLVLERVLALTDQEGCDCVVEAVGNQSALDLGTGLTRVRGKLIIAGYHQDGLRQVNMQMWNWRGIDVINAHERDPRVYVGGMQQALESIASGVLDPSPLYTHTFPLSRLSDAFTMLERRPDGFMKAIVIP